MNAFVITESLFSLHHAQMSTSAQSSENENEVALNRVYLHTNTHLPTLYSFQALIAYD